MTEPIPASAVVRVSRGTFDPSRFAEVEGANKEISEYLIPAIKRLTGLIHYYTGVSPDGSIVHISVWESDEDATQMSRLKEIIVDAREEFEARGVAFIPIVNYPIHWTI